MMIAPDSDRRPSSSIVVSVGSPAGNIDPEDGVVAQLIDQIGERGPEAAPSEPGCDRRRVAVPATVSCPAASGASRCSAHSAKTDDFDAHK